MLLSTIRQSLNSHLHYPDMKTARLAAAALAVLLAACSSAPKNETSAASSKPTKPALQTLTGRAALQKMMIPAHLWAPDIQPISIESSPSSESDGTDGKSAEWRSVWGSATKRSAKNFSWSGSATGDAITRGITPGGEDTWSSSNTSMTAFNIGFLKSDTEDALAAAKAKLTAKDAKKPVKYALAFDSHKSQLLWRVTFGEGGNDKTIDVDATTGKYERTER